MNNPMRSIFEKETGKAVFETGNSSGTSYSRQYVEWLENSVVFLMSRMELSEVKAEEKENE